MEGKAMKKLITSILTLAIISTMGIAAAASGDFTIKNGALTAYNGSGGNVVVPTGVINIMNGLSDDSITSISLPTGVKKVINIGGNSLKSINIPDSVNSLFDVTGHDYSIFIPSSVKSMDTFTPQRVKVYCYAGSYASQFFKSNSEINYCQAYGIDCIVIKPVYGTPKYMKIKAGKKVKKIIVTIPVTGTSVKSVSHVFTKSCSYMFAVKYKGAIVNKTVTVKNIR